LLHLEHIRKTATELYLGVVVWDPDGEYTEAEAEAGQEGMTSSVQSTTSSHTGQLKWSTFKRSIQAILLPTA
jgi:hypothetical protein